MGFLSFFLNEKQPSKTPVATSSLAKERLQIILAHERTVNSAADYLPALQKELLMVIAKYVKIDAEAIKVSLEKQGDLEVLELNITLPDHHND